MVKILKGNEMKARILIGDARKRLAELPAGSVRTCITSPPYFGLRDYGESDQIGLEKTPEAYVKEMLLVFREVRQVLADDGTLWLNLGDTYTSKGNLIGIPWRVAFAFQADGWILRSDIIWQKPNVMPESTKNRPTKSHEHLFLFAKSTKYFYDVDSIREPISAVSIARSKYAFNTERPSAKTTGGIHVEEMGERFVNPKGRNKRDVWTIPTASFKGAHFAVMPEALVEPCVLAGSEAGDTVLDPFTGSGTVAVVALQHGRNFVGTELNSEYGEIAKDRITKAAPMFNEVVIDDEMV